MKKDSLILTRLNELLKRTVQRSSYDQTYINTPSWEKWSTSVLNILQRVFGLESSHYKNFLRVYNNTPPFNFWSSYEQAYSILLAAKEDFEGGFLFDLENRISGELLGDFVSLAKSSLSEHHKDVAAVLACSALEDALKKFASISGLDVTEKSMQEVINALKSKSLIKGAQKGLLDSMPKIRDYAMHANWDKISEPDVNSIIGFVEQFLLTNFS